MEIIRGVIQKPIKVCLYGVEGIGKTTFASKFPNPLFIDLDNGSARLDVARVANINSWALLNSVVKKVYTDPSVCKTLVIDTADAAERLCVEKICNQYNKSGIEEFGYGNGYTYLVEEFARFLTLLEACVTQGINVVLLAHAVLKTVTKPDEMGSYDHWELKLSKKTTNQVAPLVKEWADLLIFANYKTTLLSEQGKAKKKAVGGERRMWLSHTPFADAKNRFGLPDELPFDYDQIAHIVPNGAKPLVSATQKEETKASEPVKTTKKAPKTTTKKEKTTKPKEEPVKTVNPLIQQVYDLCKQDNITIDEVRQAVAKRGYFPADVPIENYAEDFIKGVLIGAWDQMKAYILSEISPFKNN